MKRESRRSKRELALKWKRPILPDFDRLEVRRLLSTTYTVTNTNPTGAGSLFDAITQLDLATTDPSSPNVIQFDIPGGGAQTIALTEQLPDITQPTDVQGYSQPGSSANTNPLTAGDNAVLTLIISGGGSSTLNGLTFDASAAGSSVEGLDLVGFTGGVALSVNSDNTAVTGNFIGVGPNGVPTLATVNFDGLEVSGASGLTIGGTAAADRNVITGNTFEAVSLGPNGSVPASNDTIEGNFIGTAADLSTVTNPALVNDYGVLLYPGAGDSVGGTAAGAGNVISGNAIYGVGAQDALGLVLTGDVIQNNGTTGVLLISSPGASITGCTIGGATAGLGNSNYGIYLENSINVNIGGTSAGAGDLIEGNGTNGVTVDNSSNGTMVIGSTLSGNTGYGIDFGGQGGSSLSGEVVLNDVIQSNTSGGVLITDAPGTTVTSSTIGGATAGLGNLGFGVSVSGSANVTIKTSTFTHNTADGIDVSGSSGVILTGDTLQSNGGHGVLLTSSNGSLITSSTIGGTSAQGNGGGGVSVVGSTGVTIGGTTAGAGDTISGNTGFGISFNGTSTGGLVEDSTVSGNTGDGIDVAAPTSPAGGITGNTIDSNGGNGIYLDATSAAGSVLHGNTIDSNSGAGVSITSSGNTIGGTTAGAANTIASNVGAGVALHDSGTAPTGDLITGNSIVSNGALGIDLANGSGVPLPNNSGSPNNHGQNYPVITSVGVTTAGTTAKGTLEGGDDATYTIEFFSNAAADPSGHGQGHTYLTSTTVTTDATGNATFSATLGTSVTLGQFISATATDSTNDTSEFSADTVAIATTTTAVTSSANPSVSGQPVTFTATVSVVAPGSGTPTGTVEFFDGATDLGPGTAAGPGVWTITTSTLAVGTHADITAEYSGDGNDLASASADFSQAVDQASSLTTVTASANPSVYGQSVAFTATVTAVSPGAGTPTGTVEFFDGATDLGTATPNGAGVWTFTTSSLAVGTHADVTADYGGDVNFLSGDSADFSQTVDQASSQTTVTSSAEPSVYGQSVTFTATVAAVAPGAGTPTGTVEFFDGATDLGTATPAGAGVWTFTTSSLAVGAHPDITADYGGDVNFVSSTSTAFSQTVNQSVTLTTITSTVNPSVSGESVTLTASVAAVAPGAGTPTGSVTFYDGGGPIGNGTLTGPGVWSLTTGTLAVGQHSFAAVYNGNTDFQFSESASLPQAVGQASSQTTITASADPSVYGQSVTFTATVTPVIPGAGTPTGTVEFFDGATDLGPATAAGPGVWTFATSTLAAGTHPDITADYSGDTDFTTSNAVVGQTVTPAPLTITANDQTKVYGAALPTLTLSYTGFVNGETAASLATLPTLTTTATAASHVAGGPYAITASGAVDPNYAISYVSGALTVTTAPLTITAYDQTKLYGQALPPLNVSYSGLVNGDTPASLTTAPTVSTLATAASHVAGSPYAITAVGAVDTDYAISYVPGGVTVTPAPLTIAAYDQTKLYGQPLPPLNVSYTGLVNGDGPASLAAAPVVSTAATAGSHVAGGPYAITAVGAVDTDYAITYVPGGVTVTPAPLTIAAYPQFKVYGAALPPLNVSYTGFVNGDTPASLTTAPTVTTAATAFSDVTVSPYPIRVTGGVDPDYVISDVGSGVTVTPAAVTIGVAAKRMIYGRAVPALTGTIVGVLDGDAVAPIYGTSASPTSHVVSGGYPITATALSGAKAIDYAIAVTIPATLTVTPAPLSVRANHAVTTYGSPVPTLTATYGGFVNGDTAASLTTPVVLSTTAMSTSAPGSYPIVAKGGGSPDYTLTHIPGTLVVQPAGTPGQIAFVVSLYQDSLGRSPSEGEINVWTVALAGGVSQLTVARGIYNSQEAVALRAHHAIRPVGLLNAYNDALRAEANAGVA